MTDKIKECRWMVDASTNFIKYTTSPIKVGVAYLTFIGLFIRLNPANLSEGTQEIDCKKYFENWLRPTPDERILFELEVSDNYPPDDILKEFEERIKWKTRISS